jgi:hypothetical protein
MIAWMVGPPECPDVITPTQGELLCNGEKLERKALPGGAVGTNLDLGEIETRPDAAAHLMMPGDLRWVIDIKDALDAEGFPNEFGSPELTGLPPHFEFTGPNRTVDFELERETFEASVRSYAAEVLRERAKGRPVIFHYDLGPHEPQPGTELSQLAEAIENVIIPRTIFVAQTAELVQAEALLPFAGEADIFANSDVLRGLPGPQRVQWVQDYVDLVRETARQHFQGLLVGASAWQYYPADDPFWSTAAMHEVSWQGFDLVSFTLLPVTYNDCSVEFAARYFETQLATITSIAQRDGVDWMVGELDVFTFGPLSDYLPERGCVEDPRAVFLPIWEVALGALRSETPAPSAVLLMAGPSEWADDRALAATLASEFGALANALGP